MASIADIQFILSGGTSNTSQAASLGGARSTATGGRIKSQTATALSTLTGVTIDDARGNPEGAGTLSFNYTAKSFTWTPFGRSAGTPVVVTDDATIEVAGSAGVGSLVLTVVFASLPGQNIFNTVTIANINGNIIGDISKDQSLNGATFYRCFYMLNNSDDAKAAVKLWIGTNTPGEDTISIGLDPGGAGSTPTAVTDEFTAPSGVTFTSSAVSATTALSIGALDGNQAFPVWIRRIVPPNVTTPTPKNFFALNFSALV